MRYLAKDVADDLLKKMVFLSGPRQVGKTTVAKELLAAQTKERYGVYLNYDVLAHRKIIIERTWDRDADLLCLDELHKFKKWKNFLKDVVDSDRRQSVLVTGSARLDLFRKAGDALTGRYFHYRLHPIDIVEAMSLGDFRSPVLAQKHLLAHGGFPESFFNPHQSGKLAKNRIEQVLNEDIYDLTRISDLKLLEVMIEILRESNGGTLNYDSLAKKIGVSAPTAKKWIEILEKMYLIFLVTPFVSNIAKSNRKESKYYFYDMSLNLNDEGFAIENLVAACLVKQCHYLNDTMGGQYGVHYYKDSNRHEVDFVVTKGRKPVLMCEVKKSDDAFSPSLFYLKERYEGVRAVQLVSQFDGAKEKNKVKMHNLAEFLLKLDLTKS